MNAIHYIHDADAVSTSALVLPLARARTACITILVIVSDQDLAERSLCHLLSTSPKALPALKWLCPPPIHWCSPVYRNHPLTDNAHANF